MGWGIEVNGMYLSRVTESELPEKKRELTNVLELIEKHLIALAAYTYPTVTDGDETIALPYYAVTKVGELLEEYREAAVNLALVDKLMEA